MKVQLVAADGRTESVIEVHLTEAPAVIWWDRRAFLAPALDRRQHASMLLDGLEIYLETTSYVVPPALTVKTHLEHGVFLRRLRPDEA